MQRYFLKLGYKGTNYHGWQIQPNAISVQEVLNLNIRKFTRDSSINIIGCGRTDTGVHASEFYAHFDSDANFDVDNFVNSLNKMLPSDIAIDSVSCPKEEWHSRFDAESRTYKYYINHKKDPFVAEESWLYRPSLSLDKMNKAAQFILGEKDFTSFSKVKTETKTNICNVTEAIWEQNENGIVFTITANRFLRNMVRAVVGTLLLVGESKIEPEEVEKIIELKDRNKAGQSVPAHGLFLVKIRYPFING